MQRNGAKRRPFSPFRFVLVRYRSPAYWPRTNKVRCGSGSSDGATYIPRTYAGHSDRSAVTIAQQLKGTAGLTAWMSSPPFRTNTKTAFRHFAGSLRASRRTRFRTDVAERWADCFFLSPARVRQREHCLLVAARCVRWPHDATAASGDGRPLRFDDHHCHRPVVGGWQEYCGEETTGQPVGSRDNGAAGRGAACSSAKIKQTTSAILRRMVNSGGFR